MYIYVQYVAIYVCTVQYIQSVSCLYTYSRKNHETKRRSYVDTMADQLPESYETRVAVFKYAYYTRISHSHYSNKYAYLLRIYFASRGDDLQ